MKLNHCRCDSHQFGQDSLDENGIDLHWEKTAMAIIIRSLLRFPGVDQSWAKFNFSLTCFSSFRACLICAISKTINGSCSSPPLAWYWARIFAAWDSWIAAMHLRSKQDHRRRCAYQAFGYEETRALRDKPERRSISTDLRLLYWNSPNETSL